MAEIASGRPKTSAQPLTNAFDQFKRKRGPHLASGNTEGPALAAHERDRTIRKKPPSGTKRAGGGIRITKEPKIQPSQRLKEFPNHCLRISGGKLFCSCCKEELSLLKQSVKTHVSSAKHSLAKDKYVQQRQDDAHITDVLTEYFTEHNDEATAGLEPEVHLYRYRVTESLLFAGVPISKGDYLRPLLERADIKLTGSEHLRQYVPKIESLEFEHLHHELQGQSVFFILEQKKI
ncbi:hypothetical protein CYMTET_5972 [Cymbomonas tetramitiformis]|uniref:U1-type domain-containing protein n=1 Tax=Cymbomonas tetramitiformis TaxID=36881 RepID=A0AAE0GYD2_9CHLO|nr:hypothetical protein CYMTET_5972 [Cymbomonas tetramitiformis]